MDKWWRAQAICQTIAGTISFLASFIMAVTVARSKITHGNLTEMQRRQHRHQQVPQLRRHNNGEEANFCDTILALKSSPYHRIIFGLSLSDIMQSSSLLFGPIATPTSMPQAFWARGNVNTCQIAGIFFTIGTISTQMYTLLLCYFCLCKVTRRVDSDEAFARKVEWKSHWFIFGFNIITCVAALASNSLHAGSRGLFCFIGESPPGCSRIPEIFGECDESILRAARIIVFLAYLFPASVCLLGIITCMVNICLHIRIMTQHVSPSMHTTNTTRDHDGTVVQKFLRLIIRNKRKDDNQIPSSIGATASISRIQSCTHEQQEDVISHVKTGTQADQDHHALFLVNGRNKTPPIVSSEEPDIPQSSSGGSPSNTDAGDLLKLYRREFMIQASLYVLAYCITYVFIWWIPYAVFMVIKARVVDTPMLSVLGSTIYPLGGLFNILVYTRPKVLSLRRSNPTFSWVRSLTLVVGAGGVVPPIDIMMREEEGEVSHLDPRRFESSNLDDYFMNSSRYDELFQFSSNRNTPDVSMGNHLLLSSAEDIKQNVSADEDVSSNDRKYYHIPKDFNLLDSSPLALLNGDNCKASSDHSGQRSESDGKVGSFQSLLLHSGGMSMISEEVVLGNEN